MADRTLRESREAFRRLVDDVVDDSIKQRVWQLLEAIVFSETPILRGLERFEVRFGDGAPTVTEYPKDGLGVWVDETADEIYVVLKWRSEFYFVGGSGSGSLPSHTHTESEITDLPGHEHVEADITDLTHTDNTASNVGGGENIFHQKTGLDLEFRGITSLNSFLVTGYSGVTKDITLQVLPANMDHGGFAGLDDDDHQHYSLADGTRAYTGDVAIESVADPTLTLAEGGSLTYYTNITDVDIDLHIDKVTQAGPATIFIDPMSGSPGGDNFVSFFRNTDTALYGGNSVFRIYYGNGTDNLRHYWVASNGHAHLCRNAGSLTVGGSDAGVVRRLNVTGTGAFSDNLFLTLSTTEPADGELANGEMVLWYQAT